MRRLTPLVLGAAAGGGFPQCRSARSWAGDPRVTPRSQAGIAVSTDGENWLLCNASPDLRAQILNSKACIRRPAVRRPAVFPNQGGSADRGGDRSDGRIADPARAAGCRALRHPGETLAAIAGNPMFGALHPEQVTRRALSPGETVSPLEGLSVEIFTVPGKMPLYLEGENPEIGESAVNVGVELISGERRLLYIPGAAGVTPVMRERMRRAEAILFDGTLFAHDEMIALRTGTKTGMRMGHMPIEGPDGSPAALEGLSARRIFIHINNTNPVLIDGSSARRRVELAGFEVAYDSMEIVL